MNVSLKKQPSRSVDLVLWEHSFLAVSVLNEVISRCFMLLFKVMHLLEGGTEEVYRCLMQFD